MDSCSLTSPELASKLESNDFETSTCSCSDDEDNCAGGNTVTDEWSDECECNQQHINIFDTFKQRWLAWTKMKCSNHVYMVFTFFILVSVCAPLASSLQINVSLGFLTPLDESLGPLSTLGKEFESAFKIAVEAVNDGVHKVHIREDFAAAVRDETTHPGRACGAAAGAFHRNSEIVGIVGGYYSECSISVQKRLNDIKSNLPELSYRSPSIALNNKKVYRGFYRMASNNKQQAQVIIDLIKNFGWSQVGIVHTNDIYYGKELSDEIVSKLNSKYSIKLNVRVAFKTGSSSMEIDENLASVEKAGSRINVIVAQGKDIVRILKRLKAKKMYGKGWVWILTDGGTSLDLSTEHMARVAAAGAIGIAPQTFKGQGFVDNVIVRWFQKSVSDYPGRFWRPNNTMPDVSPFVRQIYLAVSTYHTLLNELANEGNLTQDTKIADIRKLLRKKLATMVDEPTSRESIFNSKVFFEDGTDGPPHFTITNYAHGSLKEVGEWNGAEDEIEKRFKWDLKRRIIWPGGSLKPPKIKGRAGKISFRVGFVGPTHPLLRGLSDIGKELQSAFKVAVDMINEDKSYKIEIEPVIRDEGFDGSVSCFQVAEELKRKNLHAVVGAYRSECSMKLHQVLGSETQMIPIVSYASLSRQLSDKNMYKYFFRVVPPNIAEAEIMQQLMKRYRFKEVSILCSDEISSKEIAMQFAASMKNLSVPVTRSVEFPQNASPDTLRAHLQDIRQSGSRVIFVSALPNDALLITQLIKELEMAGRGWIWFGSTGVATQHFRHTSSLGNVLNGMIGINPKSGDGQLYTEFRSAWKSKDALQYPGIIHSRSDKSRPYTPQVYDAVRSIGLALSDLVQRKSITFTTNTEKVRSLLFDKMKGYSAGNGFLSATGPSSEMYFDKNQDAPMAFDVVNLLGNTWKTIGRYPVKKDSIMFLVDPLFPGEVTKPVVNPGKIVYNVAAFFPTHSGLNGLAELGTVWKRALTAAVKWLKRNDTLTVDFDVISYDTGLSTQNCSQLAENIPQVDIVIGAARSDCTKNLYRVLERRGIPVISYSSTSSVLSHKSDYPNLFRVCASDDHQARALSDLVEQYSWEKVGIVGTKGIYGQELANSVSNMLNEGAIQVTTNQHFKAREEDLTQQVNALQEGGSGVNLIIANPNDAISLFQKAFRSNMVGKGWTWIGSDGATSTNFHRKQNLLAAMQGMVGIRPKTGAGDMFEQLYRELERNHPRVERKTAYLAQVFDAILLPATALHAIHLKREAQSSVLGKVSSQDLMEHLRNMNTPEKGFQSATDQTLYFDSNQDVHPYYDLVNLNGDWITVGSYNDGQLDITRGVVWPGGTIKVPPSDPPRYDVAKHVSDNEGGTTTGLVALAVVFGGFSILVIIFMVYIVRRVRHRHLYMQSDINHGGVFSVLYGHTVNRPGLPLQTTLPLQSNQLKLDSIDSGNGTEILDPMIPRNV